jgi:hypothetical protein
MTIKKDIFDEILESSVGGEPAEAATPDTSPEKENPAAFAKRASVGGTPIKPTSIGGTPVKHASVGGTPVKPLPKTPPKTRSLPKK